VTGEIIRGAERDQAADPGSYAKAILNILADFSDEKARIHDTQKATLNILADFSDEKARFAGVQKANLNILEDSAGEKVWLEATQQATLNILEDFGAETQKVEQTNREMAKEIAERKRAEEAIKQLNARLELANKELEAFSYSVSHDLRAPLRWIDGFSQILLEEYLDKLDDQGQQYLRQVRESSQQMAQLIDDLINLSRVTRAEMSKEPVDLSRIAETVAEALRKTQPDRAVEFVIEKGMMAQGDPRLLRVVLENLLGNGWKYTGKRSPPRIEFGRTEQGGRPAYFVRDNGAGFDMAYVHKLFGAFQRLHAVSEFPGTGIGLATVQRIIHRHGGRVWAEGAVEKGATFYFTLEMRREV